MDRREFLRTTGAVGAGAALAGAGLLGCDDSGPSHASILDGGAKESPIDTIVVLMMENRSFDHYYGWLGTNEDYLEAGRRRFGKDFHVDARLDLAYPDPGGRGYLPVQQLTKVATETNPWRGCGHPVPGHGWFAGRRQLAAGFLAKGTGNDEYAIGYYQNEDLPVHARLAERFTVLDHSHASLLCGTMPNRQYLHSATSQGQKEDPGPFHVGMWKTDTIWNQLDAAGVDAAYYYTDIPMLLLWGKQMRQFIRPVDRFFEDCAQGTLPRVVMVDPGFIDPLRTDDHPLSDVRIGQRFIREIFGAFVGSKHWEKGAFILTYDEWGGFFDHVPPPLLADDLASPINDDSFAQSGFRVPTVLASPYSAHGGVDHRVYDHTSIMRFIQWRFLGAPPEGPGKPNDTWFLTKRDRFANNMGASLSPAHKDLELHYDANVKIGAISEPCPDTIEADLLPLLENSDPFDVGDDLREEMGARYPGPTLTPWIEGEALKTIPNVP